MLGFDGLAQLIGLGMGKGTYKVGVLFRWQRDAARLVDDGESGHEVGEEPLQRPPVGMFRRTARPPNLVDLGDVVVYSHVVHDR